MESAFVFPGQGSQSIGMLADLATLHPEIELTFAEASEALGYEMWRLVQNGPDSELGLTERTQPIMLTAGFAVWRAWRAAGGPLPRFMAGHSVGEYSALTAAGALSFTDAVRLVRDRGRYMQEAVPLGIGGMAAIIGLSDDDVRAACQEAAQGEVVEPVNFNAPGQVAIAGHRTAVDRAVERAREKGARRAIPLALSVPAHSSLMAPAAQRLAERLAEITIRSPEVPVIHNYHVQIESDPGKIRHALSKQIDAPVRWVESINKMTSAGIDQFVECGPGVVLTGLIKRIADKTTMVTSLDQPARFDKALAAFASPTLTA